MTASIAMQVKFSFRQAIEKNDTTVLKTIVSRHSGTSQLSRLLAEETFNGFTVLQQACLQQNATMAALFIECGVDFEQRGKHGWTALHTAAFASKYDSHTVVLLLNSCANVAARDDHGCLPVDLAKTMENRELLLSRMEDRGFKKLASMYRRLDYLKSFSKADNMDDRKMDGGCNKLASMLESPDDSNNKQAQDSSLKGGKRLGSEAEAPVYPRLDDLKSTEHGFDSVFMDKKKMEQLSVDYYSSYCERREKLACDRPTMRSERARRERKVSSWSATSRSTRDSGIFSDDSDAVSINYI